MKRTSRRDESLEHLLKESLQAPWQTPASGSCPDAEVLAAWSDGALEGRELAMAREHVAGCVSCQATLAVFARTVPHEATPLPWWQRMPSLRWLVPVAATATAIAIWIAVPREEYIQPARDTIVARESAAPQPEPLPSAAKPNATIAEDSANRAPRADPRRTTMSSELRFDAAEKAATGDVSEAQPAAPPARDQALVAPREQTAETTVGTLARQEAAAPPATPPAPASQPAAPAPAQSSGFGTVRGAIATLSAQPVVVVSPGTMLRWRIGRAGSVDFSTNAGRTWEARPTGVDAELVAGASPSGAVCWIVGRTGTVLLTINGTDWRRLNSPTGLDLTGVEATDSRTAIVTAANGQRFRTTDGGVRWQGV